MRVSFFAPIVSLCLLALNGCGRDTSFVYHLRSQATLTNQYQHALKELQGNNKVDILFVVDNSSSMGNHQTNLHKNAKTFIDKFAFGSRLDWQIALASTDLNDKPYVGMTPKTLLNVATRDPVAAFQSAVNLLGLDGDTRERSFAATLKVLTENSKFVRPGATLAVILITDAKEQSEMTGDEFLKAVRALQPAGSPLIVYGVLANEDFGCEQGGEEDYDYATSPYQAAIDGTQGKVYKLCEDFGPSLADLGNDLVTRVDRPYISLQERPLLKSVQVLYQGQVLAGGAREAGGQWFYDFDLNRVVFYNLDFAPGDNESVEIKYDVYR